MKRLIIVLTVLLAIPLVLDAQDHSGGSGVSGGGSSNSPYTYIISTNGTVVSAFNTVTQLVEITNTDFGVVARAAIAACPSGGCGIFIKTGNYHCDSLGTETGGSLGYRYCISLPNTTSFLTNKSWRISGENPRTTRITISATALATTSSSEYVVGIWGQYISALQSYDDVILENFAIDFPDGNATRGNTAIVDLGYIYRQTGTNVYGTCDSWTPTGFPLPAKGSIDSVGWRTGDSFIQTSAILTGVHMQECYTDFKLGDRSTGINIIAGLAVYPYDIGYQNRSIGSGSFHGLSLPVTLIYPEQFEDIHGLLIENADLSVANAEALVIVGEYIERATSGTFSRVSEATDNSAGHIAGEISFTHADQGNSSGISPAINYFGTGGTKFKVTDLNQDQNTLGFGNTAVTFNTGNTAVSTASGTIVPVTGSLTNGHCISTNGTQLTDSGASCGGGGGGGGSISFVGAARTTAQTYSANSGTAVAVSFTGTDTTANSTMHNPSGSGACGAASKICLPASQHCTITAQVTINNGGNTAVTLAGITINLNGDLNTNGRVGANFLSPVTGTFGGGGFQAVGQIATGATDYVEVYAYDDASTGTVSLGGPASDRMTFTALCQ